MSVTEEKVKRLSLTDKILFLGTRNDVECLYQAMDVFVLPSLHEGFALVRMEAQCNGLFAVMSDVSGNEYGSIPERSLLLSLDASLNKWADAVVEAAKMANNELRLADSYDMLKSWGVEEPTKKLQALYKN
jgi:glycosyltransferase involved in cell wall biosynthesis